MRINIGRFLTRRAMLNPDKIGLTVGGSEWTFAELNLRSNRLAHALARLGVRPGDRVGMLGLNGVEHFDLFFGLAKMGAILVPVNHRLAAPELAAIFSDSGIRVLVYDPRFAAAVEKARGQDSSFKTIVTGGARGPDECYDDMLAVARSSEPMVQAGDDDEAVIIYSSWSGSRPRGVMLTHANFLWASFTAAATLTRLGPRFLLALPMHHIGALGWLPIFMHLDIQCVLMSEFDPDLFLDVIERRRVTAFGAVPTMLFYLQDSPKFASCDFTRVRDILAYGSAVPVELIEEYGRAEIRIRQLYGLTECTGPALVIDGEHALVKAGSCGLPFFHTRVKLVDELGGEVMGGSVGEVIIQAEHVMKGYWNQPEATADALRGGWLYTGDLGRRDDDGHFYIVDRKKEVIISGGENIFPAEIEGVLIEHPEVADVAVISIPDRLWGERVKAVVARKKGSRVSAENLVTWLKGKIASYKIPGSIEFVGSMPRTRTGKMEKRKLRKGSE